MSTPADLSRPLPTAATEAREEKLVESKGVEPLADLAPGPDGAGGKGGAEGAPSAPASAELIAEQLRRGTMTLFDRGGNAWQAMPLDHIQLFLPTLFQRAAKAEADLATVQDKLLQTEGYVAELRPRAQKAETELASEMQWRAQVLSDIEDACRETECPVGVRFAEWIRRLGALRQQRSEHAPSWRARATELEREAEDLREQRDRIRDELRADASTPAVEAAKEMRKRLEAAEAELAGMKTHARKVGAKMAADAAAEANAKWRHETGIAIGKDRARVAAIEVSAPPPAERLMAELSSVDCSPQLFDLLAGIIGELGR